MQHSTRSGAVGFAAIAGLLLTASPGLAASGGQRSSNRGDGGGIGPDSPSHRSTARADRAQRGRDERAAIRNPGTARQDGMDTGQSIGRRDTGRTSRDGASGSYINGYQDLYGYQGNQADQSGTTQTRQRGMGQTGERGVGQEGQAGNNQMNQRGTGLQGQQGTGQAGQVGTGQAGQAGTGQAGTGQAGQRGAGQVQRGNTYSFGGSRFGQSATGGRFGQQGMGQSGSGQFGQRGGATYGYQGEQYGQGDSGYWTRQSLGQLGTGRFDDFRAGGGGTQYGQRGATGTWGREWDRGERLRSQPGIGTYGYGGTYGTYGYDGTYGYRGDQFQQRGTAQRNWQYDADARRDPFGRDRYGQRDPYRQYGQYGQRDEFRRQDQFDRDRDRYETYGSAYDRSGRRGTDWYGRDWDRGDIYGYGTDRFGEGGRYGRGQERFGRDGDASRFRMDQYRGGYRGDRDGTRFGYRDDGRFGYRLDDDDFEYDDWDD